MVEVAKLATLPAVASYLGVSLEQLQEVIDAGVLPIVPPLAAPRIHDADLEVFVASYPTFNGMRLRRPRLLARLIHR